MSRGKRRDGQAAPKDDYANRRHCASARGIHTNRSRQKRQKTSSKDSSHIEIVPAEGLPEGWTVKTVPQRTGKNGRRLKLNRYWYSPVEGYRFRSRKGLEHFFYVLEVVGGDEVEAMNLFELSPLEIRRKRNIERNKARLRGLGLLADDESTDDSDSDKCNGLKRTQPRTRQRSKDKASWERTSMRLSRIEVSGSRVSKTDVYVQPCVVKKRDGTIIAKCATARSLRFLHVGWRNLISIVPTEEGAQNVIQAKQLFWVRDCKGRPIREDLIVSMQPGGKAEEYRNMDYCPFTSTYKEEGGLSLAREQTAQMRTLSVFKPGHGNVTLAVTANVAILRMMLGIKASSIRVPKGQNCVKISSIDPPMPRESIRIARHQSSDGDEFINMEEARVHIRRPHLWLPRCEFKDMYARLNPPHEDGEERRKQVHPTLADFEAQVERYRARLADETCET